VDHLRIGTFNLLHGVAMSGRDASGGSSAIGPGGPVPDLQQLRAAVTELDADVLGLQEVDRHQDRSGSVDQTAEVAHALGAAHWRFVPAVHGTPGDATAWSISDSDDGQDTDGPTYGVGLVSRLPVLQWQVRRFAAAPFSIPLPVPGGDGRPRMLRVPDEPRVAIAAVIDGPNGPFSVVTAHLSFVPGYNVRQLRTLARWAAGLPGPVVIAGDLNLPGSLPRRLTGWDAPVKAPTYPSLRPKIQFDHVLTRGIAPGAVTDARAWPLAVSDHCAITIDVATAALRPTVPSAARDRPAGP
jgi:endonuclease/exonuclease/phosphatase family metal-dependent hydrolase